jgi:hypothetical protein
MRAGSVVRTLIVAAARVIPLLTPVETPAVAAQKPALGIAMMGCALRRRC